MSRRSHAVNWRRNGKQAPGVMEPGTSSAHIRDSADGDVASIRLHQSLGFRIIGVLRAVGHKHGRWLDSVLLQRALGEGEAKPPP